MGSRVVGGPDGVGAYGRKDFAQTMRRPRYMRVASAMVLVAVLAGAALSAAGTGRTAISRQAHWVITDLDPQGVENSGAVAINDRGQVVGWSVSPWDGFLWQKGTRRDLGMLGSPSDINESGQIVGQTYTQSGEYHAFVWQDGTMTDLGTLGSGESKAVAINDSGWIVGANALAGDNWRAFLWQNGKMTDLGGPPRRGWCVGLNGDLTINDHDQIIGDYENCTSGSPARAFLWQRGRMTDIGSLGGPYWVTVSAINDRGQIAGESATKVMGVAGLQVIHAFLRQNGKMRDLGTLGGEESYATDINNRGQVTGLSDTKLKDKKGNPIAHGFLWQNGTMRDLGTLPGYTYSQATAINENGQAIGRVYTSTYVDDGMGDQRGFVWEDGKIVKLPTLGTKWRSTQPVAINNHGQIIGYVSTKAGNRCFPASVGCQQHAVLWTLRSGG